MHQPLNKRHSESKRQSDVRAWTVVNNGARGVHTEVWHAYRGCCLCKICRWPALPNAQHTGIGTATEQWGAPCPTRASSRQALACGSIQPHLLMFLNSFGMHAGGVASDATGARGQDLLGSLAKLPTQNPTLSRLQATPSTQGAGIPPHHFQRCPLCTLRRKLDQGTLLVPSCGRSCGRERLGRAGLLQNRLTLPNRPPP